MNVVDNAMSMFLYLDVSSSRVLVPWPDVVCSLASLKLTNITKAGLISRPRPRRHFPASSSHWLSQHQAPDWRSSLVLLAAVSQLQGLSGTQGSLQYWSWVQQTKNIIEPSRIVIIKKEMLPYKCQSPLAAWLRVRCWVLMARLHLETRREANESSWLPWDLSQPEQLQINSSQ